MLYFISLRKSTVAAICILLLSAITGFCPEALALNCPNPQPTYTPTLSKPVGMNPQPGCHYNSKANYFVDTGTWLNGAEPWDVSDNGKMAGAWWYVNRASCPDYRTNYNQWYADASQVAYYQKYSVTRTDSTSFQKDGDPIILKAPMSNSTDSNGASLTAKSFGRAVNNEGFVTGYGQKGAAYHAFVWRAATPSNPASNPDSRSSDVRLSSDPTWDLGLATIANEPINLGTTNTYALDVSQPFNIDSGVSGIIVVGMRDANLESVDPMEATSATQTDPTRRVLVPSGQSHAMFWKISLTNFNNAMSGPAPSTLSYEARTVPDMGGITSEARAVNNVGTIVGTANGFNGTGIRGFACLYPCTANANVKVLRPVTGSHTKTLALAVNDWKTVAVAPAVAEPGQVFGVSEDSSGKRHPVVWNWNPTNSDYDDAVEINNPAASSSQVYAANSFGVAVGTQDGAAAVFRDGRNSVRLADTVRLYSPTGAPISLNFFAALAVNRGGTMIVRGAQVSGQGTYTVNFLMKPTFYNVTELPSSTEEGIAKAMDYYGDNIVGRSKLSAANTGGAPKRWTITNPGAVQLAATETTLNFTSRTGEIAEASAIQTYGGMSVGYGWSNLDAPNLTRSIKTQALVWDSAGTRKHIWDSSLTKYLRNATGISSSNVGVGNGYRTSGTVLKSLATGTQYAYAFYLNPAASCAFSITDGTCVTLAELGAGTVNSINDSLYAAGQMSGGAVIWTVDGSGVRTSTTSLPADGTYAISNSAQAVNIPLDSNVMAAVGSGSDSSNHKAGLYWPATGGGAWTTPPTVVRINGNDTEFLGINGKLQAVGTTQQSFYYFRVSNSTQASIGAFYDRNNTQEDSEGDADRVAGMAQDLSSITSPDSGWLQLKTANAISDEGIIIGQGVKLDGTLAAYIARPPAANDAACW